jgi:hypothetical protein
VIAVERMGCFSADLVIAARCTFTHSKSAPDRAGWAEFWCPLDSTEFEARAHVCHCATS